MLSFLGMMLAEPRNPQFNPTSAVYAFRYGFEKGDAEATFWFGRALWLGWGCKPNRQGGSALIQAAAAKRIRWALFEMGLFHEFEKPNYPFAMIYYDAVSKTESEDELEWIDEFELHSLRRNDVWRALQDTMADCLSKPVSLEFAGQAFLFGAASTVAAASTLGHYSFLLIAIPIAGLVVAVYSLISSLLSYVIPGLDRRDKVLMDMYIAKKNA